MTDCGTNPPLNSPNPAADAYIARQGREGNSYPFTIPEIELVHNPETMTWSLVRPRMLARSVRRLIRIAGTLILKTTRLFKVAFNIPLEHHYRDFSILLPADHWLPTYQRRHPKYDRFLPHLAKYIQPSDTVIDVGANVGDTLAGMAEANSSSSYVCVEADDLFFDHLQENIRRIRSARRDLKVHVIKALVGKSVSGVVLEGRGGSKHAVKCNGGSVESRPLDELLADTGLSNLRILKTDVDGFDYDVLDSSASVIRAHKPILFFECHYDHDFQRDGYVKTLRSLKAAGYCDLTVFDNFGEVVVRTSDLDTVIQLMRYVWSQNTGRATRTIHYYDMLAVQGRDSALIDRVLADYESAEFGDVGLTT